MTRETGFAAARAWLESNDLPLPYVPPALAGKLRPLDDHTFSTRDPLPSPPIWLPGWVEELEDGPVEDYALIGLDARGGGTQALHVYVAVGPLVVLQQMPWGTPFGDPAIQRKGMLWSLENTEPLLRAAEARAGEKRRWVLALSGFDKSGWKALPDGGWRREDIVPTLRAEMGLD